MSTTARVTYDEFVRMNSRGDLGRGDERHELLFGEIRLMPWPKPPHDFAVDELTEWSFEVLPRGAARVRVQQTLGIREFESLTLPDLAWMRRHDYSRQRPRPEDVLLLVEVAHTTLSTDRNKKGKLYALAGIADYWIVNVRRRVLEVRRDPEGGAYRTVLILSPGQEARPLSFPEAALPVARLFPE